mmetsp:Transcript_29514/g.69454  ORF Transcript_29514/g.69454 Transcript_29514/m.69454 type:complete len:114 (-) Transcript_29514:640-981(-)
MNELASEVPWISGAAPVIGKLSATLAKQHNASPPHAMDCLRTVAFDVGSVEEWSGVEWSGGRTRWIRSDNCDAAMRTGGHADISTLHTRPLYPHNAAEIKTILSGRPSERSLA